MRTRPPRADVSRTTRARWSRAPATLSWSRSPYVDSMITSSAGVGRRLGIADDRESRAADVARKDKSPDVASLGRFQHDRGGAEDVSGVGVSRAHSWAYLEPLAHRRECEHERLDGAASRIPYSGGATGRPCRLRKSKSLS